MSGRYLHVMKYAVRIGCVAILSLLVLAACANTTLNTPYTILMRNPETGAFATCQHDPHHEFNSSDITDCVDRYTKAGWVNVTQPNWDYKNRPLAKP